MGLKKLLQNEAVEIKRDISEVKNYFAGFKERNPVGLFLGSLTLVGGTLLFGGLGYLALSCQTPPPNFEKTREEMTREYNAQERLVNGNLTPLSAGITILINLSLESRKQYDGSLLPPTKEEYDKLTKQVRINSKTIAEYQRENKMQVGNDSFGKTIY